MPAVCAKDILSFLYIHNIEQWHPPVHLPSVLVSAIRHWSFPLFSTFWHRLVLLVPGRPVESTQLPRLQPATRMFGKDFAILVGLILAFSLVELGTPQLVTELRALNELVLLELPWTVKYRALKRFHSEHGHCNVPRRVGENQELARWLEDEREQYRLYLRGEETNMTQEKIRKLEVLGVEWNILSAAWTQRYHELQEFRYSYGHTRVPRQWEENRQLGHWVTNQRVQYRRLREGRHSTLTEERISRLEGIGFVWNVPRLV